jgi:hypothetical protein
MKYEVKFPGKMKSDYAIKLSGGKSVSKTYLVTCIYGKYTHKFLLPSPAFFESYGKGECSSASIKKK